ISTPKSVTPAEFVVDDVARHLVILDGWWKARRWIDDDFVAMPGLDRCNHYIFGIPNDSKLHLASASVAISILLIALNDIPGELLAPLFVFGIGYSKFG